MKVTYYPGCSLEATAIDYAMSVEGVFGLLGIELEEVPDWNCCGATAAHSINHKISVDLPGRTLVQSAKLDNKAMLVPCPMCYNRLKSASTALKGPQKDQFSVQLTGKEPEIWDMANFLAQPDCIAMIQPKIVKPLEGLSIVSYYGCMASRPPAVTGEENFENPQSIDSVMKLLGANVIDWPFKTDCCGASQMLSRPDMMETLVGKLYDMALKVGAKAIVVSCQMCHMNLDAFQEKTMKKIKRKERLPIYYITEMIAVACGVKEAEIWIDKHIVDGRPLLKELGFL